jgi:N-dimethylarginine dimethylaminohydrolase
MDSVLCVNFGVVQMGTHVGVHLDFVCGTLSEAIALREQMAIRAEAAKLLSSLGFDLGEVDELFEVDHYGTEK